MRTLAAGRAAPRHHGLKEHKVLARTEAHVPWYSVAVPCALVDLLIKERLTHLMGVDYRIDQLLQFVKQEIKRVRQKYNAALNQSQLLRYGRQRRSA